MPSQRPKLRFECPPINELVVAVYFNPPIAALHSEHIGLLWSRVRADFPSVEQQMPVGGPELLEPIGEVFPMPRFWFVSEDRVNLIQVQKNAFMLNWRRQNSDYPHFAEQIKPAFDKYFRIFEDFMREDASIEELRIQRCELTYVNTIGPCDYWSGPEDTASVIPSFIILDPGLSLATTPSFNCTYSYVLASDLDLRIRVRNGESNSQPSTPLLVFEIRATGRIAGAKSAADEWYERAHDAVIDCFVGMTSKGVQDTYWNPIAETP